MSRREPRPHVWRREHGREVWSVPWTTRDTPHLTSHESGPDRSSNRTSIRCCIYSGVARGTGDSTLLLDERERETCQTTRHTGVGHTAPAAQHSVMHSQVPAPHAAAARSQGSAQAVTAHVLYGKSVSPLQYTNSTWTIDRSHIQLCTRFLSFAMGGVGGRGRDEVQYRTELQGTLSSELTWPRVFFSA